MGSLKVKTVDAGYAPKLEQDHDDGKMIEGSRGVASSRLLVRWLGGFNYADMALETECSVVN